MQIAFVNKSCRPVVVTSEGPLHELANGDLSSITKLSAPNTCIAPSALLLTITASPGLTARAILFRRFAPWPQTPVLAYISGLKPYLERSLEEAAEIAPAARPGRRLTYSMSAEGAAQKRLRRN